MRILFFFFAISLLFTIPLKAQFKAIKDRSAATNHQPTLTILQDVNYSKKSNVAEEAYDYSSINFRPTEGISLLRKDIRDQKILLVEMSLTSQLMEKSEEALVEIILNHLQIKRKNHIFRITNSEIDDLGIKHLSLQQEINQIPVYGKEIKIHIKDKGIVTVNGSYSSHTSEVAKNPKNSKEVSRQITQSLISRYNASWVESVDTDFFQIDRWKDELVYFVNETGELRLSWHHSVYSNLIDRWEVFIDAKTGEILKQYKSICQFHNHDLPEILDGPVTASADDLFGQNQTINVYNIGTTDFMIDASRTMFNAAASNLPDEPVGVIWTLNAGNTSPQNSDFGVSHIATNNGDWSGAETAVSAHSNAGIAYEYFKNTFGRESINGSGGNIISVINVSETNGAGLDNAFWNGVAMFYGNGDVAFDQLAKALDVSGHELSHGVVQTTANLEYFGESGALNESFADIFGAMIDRDDWRMGEDIVNTNVYPSGALRDMEDPHNGAATNDFGRGWQPKTYSERFTGPQDNNGVHINSGIPNHAFFLFATAIGKEKAEQVFYRALTRYLVKSSQFVDLRVAVEQSCMDLYGTPELDAAKAAFDAVEIAGGEGGNYEEEINENPGEDFLVFSDEQRSQLILTRSDGTVLANPLSSRSPISRPSVTDDGSKIVFVANDNHIYQVNINWDTGQFNEQQLSNLPEWSNVAISRDGSMVAGVLNQISNEIFVFNLEKGTQTSFELKNPTSADGVSTGDVLYADAMEFDFTNEWIMYDAANRISGDFGEDIEYWDIGFLNVWDNQTDDFATGRISKLFSGLPENISVGNPTFSENAPFIIAFDVVELVDEVNGIFNYSIFGANIETFEVSQIFSNTTLGFPSYSRDDRQLTYNFETIHLDIGISDLEANRIEGVPNTESILLAQAGWCVWFSNGIREFNTSVFGVDDPIEGLEVYPNPTSGKVNIRFEWEGSSSAKIEVFDLSGKRVFSKQEDLFTGKNEFSLELESLQKGNYIIKVTSELKSTSKLISLF